MYKFVLIIILSIPQLSSAEEFRFPAEFSLLLKKESELYKYAKEHPCGAYIDLRSTQLPYELSMFDLDWGIRDIERR